MYNSLYRLEISHPREKVSFGPRKLGDIGRDVLVVKHALGVVKRQSEIANEAGPNENLSLLDPNHWFDCIKGVPVSNVEAATFDKNLQTYLMRFQTENQFYILSYLFSHYAIPETTEKIYSIRRRGSYQPPEIEDYETAGTISPWVTSGANRTLLPAGRSIILSESDNDTTTRYQNHQFLSKQVEKIASLYNSEFGSIGEATLAVMHGWLPRTTLSSQSYYYDKKTFEYLTEAHDVILKPVHYSRFSSDDIAQNEGIKRSSSEDDNIISSFYNITEREDSPQVIGEYYRQVSLSEKIDFTTEENQSISTTNISYNPKDFSLVSYDVSTRPGPSEPGSDDGYKSILYQAIEQISDPSNNIPRAENVRALSDRDYTEALNRISEPDPLIDPDPFVVNDSTIGYFSRTDYTLENLPPFMPTDAQPGDNATRQYSLAIRSLEDKALTEILKFYGKPEIFYLDTRNEEFRKTFVDKSGEKYFFEDEDGEIQRPRDKDGSLLNSVYKSAKDSVWVLTTKHTQTSLNLVESYPNEYEIYQDFERPGPTMLPFKYGDHPHEPLIKFIEFVTPSLRPGDNYRAKFHINKSKLDFIKNGYTDKEQHNLLIQQFSDASKRSQNVINPLNRVDEDCVIEQQQDDNNQQIQSPFTIGRSERDEKRRYQEYRALTSKRKKEVQRALREATIDTFRTDDGANSVSVDLGVLGNANLNFDTFNLGPYDYTTGVLNTFGSLLSSGIDANISNPTLSKYGDLKISFPNLQSRIKVASSDLRKAYMASIKERITFNDTKFNGAKEALLLGNLPAELKQCIQRNKVPKDPPFRFGDEAFGIGEGNYFDVSPLSRFTGTFLNEIQFKFDQVSGGMQISGIKAGDSYVPTSEIKKYRSLSNPRTVAYLAQIYDMTGGQLNEDLGLKSLFDFDIPACHEIGLGKRGLGYLKKYTPGLKGNLEEFNPISQWYQENVEDPFYKWVDRSKSNLDRTWNTSFNEDEMLQLLGKTCELRVLYKDFLKKLSLPGLLCDFIKCLRLPGFELKIPNFQLPPFPNIDIFGWYKNLVKFILKQLFDIVVRIACTFVRMIIDFLNFPFCQEQLRDQLYGELSSTSPIIQQAVVDGLTDLGIQISDENIESVKDFAEQSLLFLTGDEVCRLLNGERIDPVSMSMLERLASKNGIDDLNSEDRIMEFFNTIGVFIPDGFCENLQSDALSNWALGSFGCDETTSYVDQIRKRMLAGGASDEEIDKAIDLANKNLQDQVDKLQALGEVGISDLLPDVVNFGDPNAIISDLPPSLKEQSTTAAKGLFESARMAYLSSLSNFAPSLFLSAPRITRPPDPDFDYDSQIIVSTILENFKIFTLLVEEFEANSPGEPPGSTELIKRINALYQVYETEGPPGQKVCKTYKWTGQGNFNTANQVDFYTENRTNFEPITLQEIADGPPTLEIVLKPAGYLENGYYLPLPSGTPQNEVENLRGTNFAPPDNIGSQIFDFTGPACQEIDGPDISIPAISAEDSPIDVPIPAFCTVPISENSNLANFSFVMPYLMEVRAVKLSRLNAQAISDQPGQTAEVLPENLPMIMLNRILVNRITELRSELGFHLTRVSSIKQGNEYLGGIRELFSLTQENMLENLIIQNRNQDNRVEVVDVATLNNGPIKLETNFGSLQSALNYQEHLDEQPRQEIIDSGIRRDAYTIKLYRDNMFRVRNSEGFLDPRTLDNALKIDVCDIIEINNEETTLYSRRELFAKRVVSSIRSFSELYGNEVNTTEEQFSSVSAAFENQIYSKGMEGIFEQVFFSTRQSRIYDVENYYPDFQRRVSGETYTAPAGNDQGFCYRNRFNVPQLAILSFDKIVTDELGSQISKEMAKEEGYPYNIDYTKAGPVERAIQNVCLIGFVRICLVELLLKGSLVYTSWDFEEVFQEKSIQEFIFQYVKSELNRKESMKQNWKSMVSQITGIDNYEIALRKLVENQSMKLLDLSKEIFQNTPTSEDDKFLSWYSRNYVPQSHCSRKVKVVSGYEPDIITETKIDLDGNVIGTLAGAESRSKNLGKFYWIHPLMDSGNYSFINRLAAQQDLNDEEPRVSLEQINAAIRASSYVQGDDPFFHIEHYLEVSGPLASVESLVIPGRQIIDDMINIPDNSPNSLSERRRNRLTFIGKDETRGVPIEHRATSVPGEPIRDREYMNISGARSRFRNLTPIRERHYESYGFVGRPSIRGDAQGTAEERVRFFEEQEDSPYSELTEVFHIEDFVSALRFALADSNLDKFRNHLLGLMHYTENPDDFEYPVIDTQEPALHRHPETVRRTPVRFIKKVRKIIKVKNDFLSHPYNEFYYGSTGQTADGSPIDVLTYKEKLFSDPETIHRFLETPGAQGEENSFKNTFKNEIEEISEEVRWFIVSANGEDIISILKEADDSLFRPIGNNDVGQVINSRISLPRSGPTMLYASFCNGNYESLYNKLSGDSAPGRPTKKFDVFLDQVKLNHEAGHGVMPINSISLHQPNSNTLTESWVKIKDLTRVDFDADAVEGRSKVQLKANEVGIGTISLGGPSDAIPLSVGQGNEPSKDFLNFQPDQVLNTTHEVFSNKIGEFLNEESYNFYKSRWQRINSDEALIPDNPDSIGNLFVEENWHETVIEFSESTDDSGDDSSILAGLYGSYTIGETMDPAVLNFIPDNDTKQQFNNEIITIMADKMGQVTRQPGDIYRKAYGISYGPTFWMDRRGDNEDNPPEWTDASGNNIAGPFIARPMGIDKFTNFKFTSSILTNNNQSISSGDYIDLISPFKSGFISQLSSTSPLSPDYADIGLKSVLTELVSLSSNQGPDWIENNAPDWGSRVDGITNLQDRPPIGSGDFAHTRRYIHKTPTIAFLAGDENVRQISYPKLTLLPPNVYKIPLRLLITQVYIENTVTAAYARFVAPRYIQNMATDREADVYTDYNPSLVVPPGTDDPPGKRPFLADGPTAQNVSTLNQAMRNIFDDYELFMGRMSLADTTTREQIVQQHFTPYGSNGSEFPNFSREFYNDFTAAGGRRKFQCELDFKEREGPGHAPIYCSIERIYSEAFAMETRQNTWNSNQELDNLFSQDRGFLLRKEETPIRSARSLEAIMETFSRTVFFDGLGGQITGITPPDPDNYIGGDIKSFSIIKKKTNLINHLESQHYFYHELVHGYEEDNVQSQKFHRLSFSIHNLLQWYLRNRTQDSLWGLLTPHKTNKSTAQFGKIGEQIQPLVQQAVYRPRGDRVKPFSNAGSMYIPNAPWSHAMHRTSFDGTKFGTKNDRKKFYTRRNWPTKDYDQKYTHTYYHRPGVMTLMHDFAEYLSADDRSTPPQRGVNNNQEVSWGPQINIYNNPTTIDNNENSKTYKKWSLDYSTGQNTDNLADSTLTRDGVGHYFVNYNRTSGFPMKEYGTSMFYGDGRFSLSDLCNFFNTSIMSIFRTEEEIKNSQTVDFSQRKHPLHTDSYINRAIAGLFLDDNTGNVHQSSFFRILYKLVFDDPSSRDLAELGITDAEINIAFGSLMGDGNQDERDSWLYPLKVLFGTGPGNPAPITQLLAIPNELRIQRRYVTVLEDVLDMQIDFLGKMIEKTGALAQYQVKTEASDYFDNVYSEQEKCMKAMEYMRRLLKFAKMAAPSFMSKLTIMALACRHGFATAMVDLFSRRPHVGLGYSAPESYGASRLLIERAKYEECKLGLYWFHLLLAGVSKLNITGLYDGALIGFRSPWADRGASRSSYFVLRNTNLNPDSQFVKAMTRIFKLVCQPGLHARNLPAYRDEQDWINAADENVRMGAYCSFRINGRMIQDTYKSQTLKFRLGPGFRGGHDPTLVQSTDGELGSEPVTGTGPHKIFGNDNAGVNRYMNIDPNRTYAQFIDQQGAFIPRLDQITLDSMTDLLPGGELSYRASWSNAAAKEWINVEKQNGDIIRIPEAQFASWDARGREEMNQRGFLGWGLVYDYQADNRVYPTLDQIYNDLEVIVKNIRGLEMQGINDDDDAVAFIDRLAPNSDDPWSLIVEKGIEQLGAQFGGLFDESGNTYYFPSDQFLTGRFTGPRIGKSVSYNPISQETLPNAQAGEIHPRRDRRYDQEWYRNSKDWPMIGSADQLAEVNRRIRKENYSPYALRGQIFSSQGIGDITPIVGGLARGQHRLHFDKFTGVPGGGIFRNYSLNTIARARSEDFLSRISYDEYRMLTENENVFYYKFLKEKMYNAEDYSRCISKNCKFSSEGVYKQLANRTNVLLAAHGGNEDPNEFPLYPQIMNSMKDQWILAFNSYTDIPQALNRLIDNQEVIVADQIVDNLLSKSKIHQAARLVFNAPRIKDIISNDEFRGFLSSASVAKLSQELRSIYMNGVHMEDTAALLCIPLVTKREEISTFNTGTPSDIFVDCYDLETLKEKFEQRAPWMAQQLLEQEDSKIYFEYIFPTKRYQALATIFATTTLSGYSTMPTFMESPKASLAFLMNIAGLNSQERNRFFNNMSQSDLYKAFTDNKVSDARGMECFDLPFSTEFLEDFMSMLLEAIKEFPSLLFRGIASVVDPAYKEMKLHYQNCEISNLTFGAINTKSADKLDRLQPDGTRSLRGGLQFRTDRKKDGKYSPLVSTFGRDIVYSVDQLLSLTPNTGPMKYTMRHFVNYLYKGPLSLFDGAFQFSIPCVEKANFEWDPSGTLNAGRYGHPISPLTAIALAMPELKGDKKLREISGKCSIDGGNIIAPYSRGSLENPELKCNDVPPAAFGDKIPNPDDFK